MTSISSMNIRQFSSPRELLQNELTSEITAGTVDSADGTALSNALDDIDTAIKSDHDAARGSQRPSPSDMKAKIDDLIASEVKDGKLTDSQADELKNIFAKTFQNGAPHGPGGSGGPGGRGGMGGSGGAGDVQSASAGSGTEQLLKDFLKLLQDAQGVSGYKAAGDAQNQISSLLMNYQA